MTIPPRFQLLFGPFQKYGYSDYEYWYIVGMVDIASDQSRKKLVDSEIGSTDDSSKISSQSMQFMIEKLKCMQNRDSTFRTYMSVWRQFNKFVIQLDVMPIHWEERATMFAAY